MDSNYQLIPKQEPFDVDFIKEEEFKEECYVEPGVVVSLKVNKVSVKDELDENKKIKNSSSSNVWNNRFCILKYYVFFLFNILIFENEYIS